MNMYMYVQGYEAIDENEVLSFYTMNTSRSYAS